MLAEKVVTVQRDFGDRSDRKHARLKYTIERIGLAEFRAELERRLGYTLSAARDFAFTDNGDRLGWAEGDDGAWHFTLFVENGRVRDRTIALLSGLHAIAELGVGRFIITPNQNLVLADIPAERKAEVEALLQAHGLDATGRRRCGAMRWPAWRCRPAVSRWRRANATCRSWSRAWKTNWSSVGLAQDDITIRMTGCPNGCARPYLAEIGLVGRSPGVYNLYLGGAFDGTRMNKLYRRDVGGDAIVAALTPLFRDYAEHRAPDERFGDYAIRAGHIRPTTAGNTFHEDLAPELRS